jgi:hypothetical protein
MKIKLNFEDNEKEVKKETKDLNKTFNTDGFHEKKEGEVKKKGRDIEITIKSKKKFKPKD